MTEYRIERREGQRFLALNRTFAEENKQDENGRSIAEFWTECYEKGLIAPMMRLCPKGNREIYGLCAMLKERKKYFSYGIGVLLDNDADRAEIFRLLECGYSIWETAPNDYAVFRCMGTDAKCLHETWRKFFAEFSPESDYLHTGDTDFELYPEPEEEGLFCELWIPVKKNKI